MLCSSFEQEQVVVGGVGSHSKEPTTDNLPGTAKLRSRFTTYAPLFKQLL